MVHVDKVKPYEADELPRSWLGEVNYDAPADSEDGVGELRLDWQDSGGSDMPVADPEARNFGVAEAGEGQRDDVVVQNLVEARQVPVAIAGVPPVSCKSPRPQRAHRRPQRYLK